MLEAAPTPRVSVLIPTWNGADTLAELLPLLREQEPDPAWGLPTAAAVEIRALDSGSTDGTQALLDEHGVHWRPIDRRTFSHGGTRNELAAEARGELLVYLSQDAVPADRRFLRELLAPFADPRVAGICARVVPFEDSDPLTARTVLDLPEASRGSCAKDLDEVGSVWDAAPEVRAEFLRFNNVASAMRSEVFADYPFPPIDFGEDFAWAARVLTGGWRLVHAGGAVVRHAHRYGPLGAYRRYRVDAAFHRAAHGWNLRPSLVSVARGVAYELLADLAYIRRNHWRGAGHLLRAPALRAAQVWGQYRGGRSPMVLAPFRAR